MAKANSSTTPTVWPNQARTDESISEPTNPPASSGRRFCSQFGNSAASSTGLHSSKIVSPASPMAVLYGGLPELSIGRKWRYSHTPTATMPHHADRPNR